MEQSVPGGSTGPGNRLDGFGLSKFLTIKTKHLFCLGLVLLPPSAGVSQMRVSLNQ